jgi:hypothetical protein
MAMVRECAAKLAHVAALGAVAQRLVHQHQRQHGLGNGRGADAHAGVVAAGGDHFDRLPLTSTLAPAGAGWRSA